MSKDFVLGIDLGGTKMALATALLDGVLLHRQVIPTNAPQGAEQAIARAFETGHQLIARTLEEQGGKLLGVGVANMGITYEDRVLMAPNVPGWQQLALPCLLRQSFAINTIRIENDVKAAAHAELRWGALVGTDVGLYLNLGTGIAATLIVNGQVVQGAHGAAGEIAYNLRHLHDDQGYHQGMAPLEAFAGGKGIGDRARQQFEGANNVEEIFQRVQTDPLARAFVEATLTEIAYHLTNLTIALDPERIAIGGGLMRSKDLILPRLEAHLKRFAPFPPIVQSAHFSQDAGLIGAVALAIP